MAARLSLIATCILAGLVLVSVPPAQADDPPAPPKPADADALRGPAVAKHPDRPVRSIVQRDFSGRLKKLEDVPALVALANLDLSAEEKSAVDRALGARAAAIDTIVRDNLRLIIELAGANEAKDKAAAARLQSEVFQKAQPFIARGPILGEIKPALHADKFAELERMVDEYNAIAVQERMAEPAAGEKPNRFGAFLAQGFESFGQEARASYQRVVEAGGKDFENLLKMLQLSPEQESKIRQEATDLYLKTYGKPTRRQQIRLFLDIYAKLDTEQRHALSRYIGEEGRVRRAPIASTPKPAPDEPATAPMQPDDPMQGKP